MKSVPNYRHDWPHCMQFRRKPWSERHPYLDEAARLGLCLTILFFTPFLFGLVL